MSAAGAGGCGPGPGSGAGSGASNPRKFSEKIALHTQRQAEETAAFQEVMMDISSTRVSLESGRQQRERETHPGGGQAPLGVSEMQGPRASRQRGHHPPGCLLTATRRPRPPLACFSLSLSVSQGPFLSSLDSSRGTRHHGLVERVQRDRRFMSPLRHYRRQIDSSPYSAAYLSPPPDASWRRTNSDSALHTSVMNPNAQDAFGSGPGLAPQNRHSGLIEGDGRKSKFVLLFSFPGVNIIYCWPSVICFLLPRFLNRGVVSCCTCSVVLKGQRLKAPCSRRLAHPYEDIPRPQRDMPHPHEDIPAPTETCHTHMNICPTPIETCHTHVKTYPAPTETCPTYKKMCPTPTETSTNAVLSAEILRGSGNQEIGVGFGPLPTPLDPEEPPFPSLSGGSSTGNLASTLTQLGINPGGAYHSPVLSSSLQGNLSNPTLQSSLSNPNIQSSLSSHSFQSSLSSASLHSSLSNPSLQSSLSSSPSLQSSFSNQSLQSSLSNSSLSGQSIQSSASNPSYSSGVGSSASSSSSSSSSYTPPMSGQQQLSLSTSPRRRAQLSPLILPMGGDSRRHHVKQFSPTISPTLSSITQGVPLDTSKLPPYPYSQGGPQPPGPPTSHQPLQKGGASSPAGQLQQQQQQPPSSQHPLHPQQPSGAHPAQSQSQPPLPPPGQQPQQQHAHLQAQSAQGMRQPRDGSAVVSTAACQPLGAGDSSLLNSLLDDPYLDLQLTAQQTQVLSQQARAIAGRRVGLGDGSLAFSGPSDPHVLNKHNQSYGCGVGRHGNVPNIILTGDSPPGLSKEITSALAGVPGFEVDPFSLDDSLALEGLGILADGDLMLPDPSVEDSFRSDRLK
nr:PREDICTED: CREB-regulated transcription coactivator 2-like [Lepisosteus oculatus]